MAKDAKGHGSEARGTPQMMAAWNRANAQHQSGVHQVGKTPGWGAVVADQARRFAKDQSGQGKSLMHHMQTDPEKYQNAIESLVGGLHEGHIGPSTLMHLAHFVGFLASVAVVDVLIQWARL